MLEDYNCLCLRPLLSVTDTRTQSTVARHVRPMFLLELSKADKMLIDNFVHNIINYAASWGRFISIRLYRAKLSH